MVRKLMPSAVVIITLLSGCRGIYKISADMDRRGVGSAPILTHSEELSVSEWENKFWPKRTEVITYNFPDARVGVISSDTSNPYIIPREQRRSYPLGGFNDYNQRLDRSIYPSQSSRDVIIIQRGR